MVIVTRFLSAVVVFVFTIVAAFAGERVARPVDEAASDVSFVEFRKRLLEAVVRHDAAEVAAMASKSIQLDFGGGAGRDEFRRRLTLTETDLSPDYAHLADQQREAYWDALEQVIRLGGRYRKDGAFHAPYTWTVDLADNEDPFETAFVIGEDVAVRDRASRYGEIKARLSYNIVRTLGEAKGTRFTRIVLPGGGTGYIDSADLRGATDHRAIFENNNGRWMMTLFLAGD